MADDRKTVYVNDKPISIFLWAEVQHCVNAYDSDLYLRCIKERLRSWMKKETESAGVDLPGMVNISMYGSPAIPHRP